MWCAYGVKVIQCWLRRVGNDRAETARDLVGPLPRYWNLCADVLLEDCLYLERGASVNAENLVYIGYG